MTTFNRLKHINQNYKPIIQNGGIWCGSAARVADLWSTLGSFSLLLQTGQTRLLSQHVVENLSLLLFLSQGFLCVSAPAHSRTAAPPDCEKTLPPGVWARELHSSWTSEADVCCSPADSLQDLCCVVILDSDLPGEGQFLPSALFWQGGGVLRSLHKDFQAPAGCRRRRPTGRSVTSQREFRYEGGAPEVQTPPWWRPPPRTPSDGDLDSWSLLVYEH